MAVSAPVPVPDPLVLVDGEAHESLREALAVAGDGALVELLPGVHAGPLDLTRSVEIVARTDAGEVAIESYSPVAVRVRAGAKVVLRGLVLRATGPRGVAGEAAVIVNGAELALVDCRVVSRQSGAIEVLSGQLTIQGGRVAAELWQTCVLLGQDSVGKFSNVEIESLAEPGSAVEVWQSVLELKSCRIVAQGAALAAGPGAEVEGTSCRLQGRTGAWAAAGATLVLADTHLREADVGVRAAGKLTLRRCTVARCALGLEVSGPTAEVVLTSCEFLANGVNRRLVDGATERQVRAADTAL